MALTVTDIYVGKISAEEAALSEAKSRVRRVYVSPVGLLDILSGGKRKFQVITGVPIDAEIARAGYSTETDNFYLILRSPEFEPVPIGELIPEMEVMVEVEIAI